MRIRTGMAVLAIVICILCVPLGVAAESKPAALSDMETCKLSFDEIMRDVVGKVETYPKYTTQLLNIANRNSQATRARYVGQMSDLIQAFPGDTYNGWVKWYTEKHPDAVETATDRTYKMIKKMRAAMAEIDREMVHRWINELVLAKTYTGLRFQKSILKELAADADDTWRLAEPKEESRGIDGYIGTTPVSIKPVSYISKPELQDDIGPEIIFYKKVRGGIRVYY